MNRADFTKLIGAGDKDEYLPVACLLRSGHGVAGYFNSQLNNDLTESFVLINARLVDLHSDQSGSRVHVRDFNEFLEDIVLAHYNSAETATNTESEAYAQSIPLAAIDLNEVAIVYPVAHISDMMKDVGNDEKDVPTFLDFDNKSVVLRLLRTKLW